MMVCLCHPFSDKKVKEHLSAQSKGCTVARTYKACSGGEKPQCCTCLETVKEMVKAHNRKVCTNAA